MTDKVRRVRIEEEFEGWFDGPDISNPLDGGQLVDGVACADDPSGTHALVPREVWERLVYSLKDAESTLQHFRCMSQCMAIRDALKEIGGGDE